MQVTIRRTKKKQKHLAPHHILPPGRVRRAYSRRDCVTPTFHPTSTKPEAGQRTTSPGNWGKEWCMMWVLFAATCYSIPPLYRQPKANATKSYYPPTTHLLAAPGSPPDSNAVGMTQATTHMVASISLWSTRRLIKACWPVDVTAACTRNLF